MNAPPSSRRGSDVTTLATSSEQRRVPAANGTESRLWFSDREIGAGKKWAKPEFSASDYRSELERVERKRIKATVVVIVALGVVAFVLACILFGMIEKPASL